MLEKYNSEIEKISDLEKELETMRAERDSLQLSLNEYMGNTYDGTILSTDTKYIAFENTLENISFTEDQFNNTMNELMTKGEVDLTNIDIDDPKIRLNVKVYDEIQDLKITVYRNNVSIGSAVYNASLSKFVDVNHGDVFRFECTGMPDRYQRNLRLRYSKGNNGFDGAVDVVRVNQTEYIGRIDFSADGGIRDVVGDIGDLNCYLE